MGKTPLFRWKNKVTSSVAVPLILLVLTTSILLFRQPLWHFLSPWILRHVQMPCVLQHFVSILCYSQWVLHVHVQNSEKKKRMEARTMLVTHPNVFNKQWYCTQVNTSHHNVFAAPPQTQPHLWRKITTCLTSHHNVIAAPPQTQPHDHVHRIKMHEFPGAVLDDVSKNKPHVFSAYFFSKAPEKTEFDVVLKEVPKDGQAASGALVRKSPDWAYPIWTHIYNII